jgi:hypothetical protein
VRVRIGLSKMTRGWVCGLLMLAVGLTASCTSSSKRIGPVQGASIGGDPAIYAAAISEIQSYLTMEVEHGPYAAAAAYLVADEQAPVGADTTWPVADADPQTPVLTAGSVSSYVPWSWTSADQFTLSVTFDLHYRGDPGRANWSEGRNTRFFIFSRPTAQAGWRMEIATGP